MSGPFETRLADRTVDALNTSQVEAGDRLVAEFNEAATADAYIESLYETVDKESFTVSFEGDTQEVPGFRTADGLPVYAVRVHSEEDTTDWSEYDVTQGYATTLRNELATAGTEAALLLTYPAGVEIDTLDTTRELFAEDGILPLSAVYEDLLENTDDLSKQGRALLAELRPYLEQSTSGSIVPTLRTLCAIRECLETGADENLPELIPEVDLFIREDKFATWLSEGGSESDLRSKANEVLSDNRTHAKRLKEAHGIGVNTREKLLESYKEEFVDEVIAMTDDWRTINHTRAKEAEPVVEGPPGGTGKPTPKFERLDIDAIESRVHSSGSGSQTHRGVLALPGADGVTLTLEFSADVEDEPLEFVDSAGDSIGDVSVDGRTITATLKPTDPDVPQFGSLRIYIGHQARRGNPKCRIDLALLPEWFFVAASENALAVSVDDEALISHDEGPITLEKPVDEEIEDVEIEAETDDIVFDRPLRIVPNPPAQIGVQTVAIHGDGPAPVTVRFHSEVAGTKSERVTFPLFLSAIADPDAWGDDTLYVSDSLSIDTNKGQLHPPNRAGVEFPDEDLRLLQIEEEIQQNADPRGRVVEGTTVAAGEIANPDQALPDGIEQAYARLFEHLESRDRSLSTVRWDEPTKRAVEEVLETFETAVNTIESEVSSEYDSCRSLGTIESASSETRWLTPYHPVMLAYGLRIAEWRDEELIPSGATGGFKNDRFVELFDPSGLLPYAWTDGDDLLQGRLQGVNHLWSRYDTVGGLGSQTPDYLDQVVADKLDAFQNAFPVLFELHPERQIVINLINMGDLAPVIEGLFDFVRKLDDPEGCPNILLRIYGGPTEGEEVEKFFAESARSSLQDDLNKRSSEIVDLLQRNVYFVRKEQFEGEEAKPAHITFFRGMLEERSGKVSYHTLPSGLRRDGLLPQESIDVTTEDGEIISRVGFGDDPKEENQIRRISRISNALEAKGNDAFRADASLSKTISSAGRTNLSTIWDRSLWVSHVEPKVGLDFYLESEASGVDTPDDESTLMIHYSDQYNASSPNFDVITTTRKRDPYVQAIRTALREHDALDQLEPESVLRQLVAIDGALALDLLRAEGTRITELIGFVGGLAVSRSILQSERPDHVWIPVSLAELARHDRSRRSGDKGILQYDVSGPASDDICLVGIPNDPEGTPEVKLWLVETKGGSASVKKGRKQIENGRESLEATFHPEEGFADTPLVRAEFGKLINGIASRLESYGVLEDLQTNVVDEHSEALRDGEYEISFLRDDDGHIGEVIRVQPDKAYPEYGSQDRVRSLLLPIDAIRALEAGTSVQDVIETFPMHNVRFQEGRVDRPETREPSTEAIEEEVTEPHEGGPESEAEETRTGATASAATARETQQEPSSAEEASAEEATASDFSEESTGHVETEESPESSPPEESSKGAAEEAAESAQPPEETSEPTPTSETPPETRGSPEPETTQAGYDWSERAFRQLTATLEESPSNDPDIDISRLVDDLTEQFSSLGVDIHRPNPADVSIGPRKIGVNIHPKRGQKIEGILKSLNSVSVHIQAHGSITGEPNPSEGAVRIEIPHGDPRDVYLREAFDALGEDLFTPLTIPLGITSENEHRTLNLVDERHALIAGSTGSGKSNFLSTIVTSLAATQSPERLSLSLLDPKGVDFTRFAPLPHVGQGEYIDTPEDCATYLLDLVETELPKRQKRLRESGATNIREHNELAASDEFDVEPLPYRVIVIDEYADLTMSLDDPDELEEAVTRIAQKGRAMGYVLLLATQRPSADIVSGKIKANFPCRISFRLPSNTDSRVILDKPGAEDLEGAGDMITITQSGREHHLQGYRLLMKDALRVRRTLSKDE